MQNIFELFYNNDQKVPFKAKRQNWDNRFYVVVEKVEPKQTPTGTYGKAYGYPCKDGIRNNHFAYDKKWREEGIIPNAGSYQWELVED